MKTLYYTLLFILIGCTKPTLIKNNDLVKENLKGNVKSIYTEKYYIKMKNGMPKKQGKALKKEINFFNQYGLKTYSCVSFSGYTYKSKHYFEYKIDNQNRIKSKTEKSPNNSIEERDFYYSKNCISSTLSIDNKIVCKIIELYNNDRIIRTNYFTEHKKTNKYSSYSFTNYLYNNRNQDSIISNCNFSEKKKKFVLTTQQKYFYDNNTHELSNYNTYFLWDDFRDPANVLVIQRKKFIFKEYRYKYDKVGNWVEKVVLENNVLTKYKRKIKYFA